MKVRLRTGDTVRIRPVRSTDASELQRAFAVLSEEWRYRRFLTGTLRLSDSQAAYFTEVDHDNHEAYVAHPAQDASRIVGVARFVRCLAAHDEAELAITIADDWHNRGLATVLIRELSARAREVGVTRFRAEMLADNRAALQLLRSAGLTGEKAAGQLVSGHIDLVAAE